MLSLNKNNIDKWLSCALFAKPFAAIRKFKKLFDLKDAT